jgi:hypothetical protein
MRGYMRARYATPEWKAWRKDYRLRLRKALIDFYGGKCACCGETEYKFLALDHVNNDGAEERRKPGLGSTEAVGRKILKGILVKENYQLLCHNCNLAKGFYGACPHA